MGGHQVFVGVTRGVHVVREWVEADNRDVLGLLSYDDLTTHDMMIDTMTQVCQVMR